LVTSRKSLRQRGKDEPFRANPGELLEVGMNRLTLGQVSFIALASAPLCFAQDRTITRDLGRINDAKSWSVINAEFSVSVEQGKAVVRLKPKGKSGKGSVIGMALVEGAEFTQGAIDIDLKGRGKQQASFLGLAFSVVDGKTFEAVYFRPFNFIRDEKASRAHAVQYVAWPDYTWERLRKTKPGVYESGINPVPDPAGWFHAHVEVTKKKVRVFVNEAKEPCLVVDRLAGRDRGRVGLWVDSREGAFANLKITLRKSVSAGRQTPAARADPRPLCEKS
jgi:hypothetical protein